eukprot:scaffold2193_cov171-Amphora_coffeaeformis.AAC.27
MTFNDFVEDTPIQNGPSSLLIDDCRLYLDGAQSLPDSCPNLPGKDALFNFLNYAGNDECLHKEGSFTCGQRMRMWKHWNLFRDQVTTCEDPDDMEIEVSFVFDQSYEAENKFRLTNSEGYVIFDSVRDHWVAYMLAREESLYIDICVPRNTDYELQILDRGRNGFRNGKILIFTDRAVTQRVSGNFGDAVTLKIPSRPPQAPSSAPSLAPSFTYSESPSLYPTQSARPSLSAEPTVTFSSQPSLAPSSSRVPSERPSIGPSVVPSSAPSEFPSFFPTEKPSVQPSLRPSKVPTADPSDAPTMSPSDIPSAAPSYAVTSDFPSGSPSRTPTDIPTPRLSSLMDESLSLLFDKSPTLSPSKARGSNKYIFVPVTQKNGNDSTDTPVLKDESHLTEASETAHPPSYSSRNPCIAGTIAGLLLLCSLWEGF